MGYIFSFVNFPVLVELSEQIGAPNFLEFPPKERSQLLR